jgi:hypothetical protein
MPLHIYFEYAHFEADIRYEVFWELDFSAFQTLEL